jgi:hypothetical protein
MRIIYLSLLVVWLTGCSTQFNNQQILDKQFPSVQGESLDGKQYLIPKDLNGQLSLLLIGYKQDSQFDIDRWLIALEMTNTIIDVYELPTIQGLFPRMFSTFIDNGMRKGIPKSLWKGVITIYADGDKVQAFTGNENPNNARVVLLDGSGSVRYFYDEGFSITALKNLQQVINQLNTLP